MFTRILVPLDGSPLAEEAIPHAELFARIFRSSIILLHVLESLPYKENPQAVDPLSWQIHKAEADQYMQGVASRIREHLSNFYTDHDELESRVSYAVREGKTAENIVDFAHAESIDLLIISTHGASGLSRWNMSSITQKVANLVYLPVLIVRAYYRSWTGEEMRRYQKILLPIDGSRRAECSLAPGIELARANAMADTPPDENAVEPPKLVLAAVIRPPELPIPTPIPAEVNQLLEQLMEVSRQVVKRYLDEMKERLPVACETCVVENPSITSAIQELADQEDVDLVVLCAHGFSGQGAWPYGTIARNYMEHGNKPVLVIQDVPHAQARPTAAEMAAEKVGRR